jgi:hypothetical protein
MADRVRATDRELEPPAVALKPVLIAAVSFLVLVGFAIAAATVFYDWDIHTPLTVPPKAFPAPQLQTDDAADLKDFKARQRAQLDAYGWVDRDRGVIRIPVDRAMGIVAAKGADGFGPVGQNASSSSAKPAQP